MLNAQVNGGDGDDRSQISEDEIGLSDRVERLENFLQFWLPEGSNSRNLPPPTELSNHDKPSGPINSRVGHSEVIGLDFDAISIFQENSTKK